VTDAIIGLVGVVVGALIAGGFGVLRQWLETKGAVDAATLRCLARLEKIQADPKSETEYDYSVPTWTCSSMPSGAFGVRASEPGTGLSTRR
jgi:membrane protein required for beta-lactamase induction